jgi:hypothetical protein
MAEELGSCDEKGLPATRQNPPPVISRPKVGRVADAAGKG